MTTQELHIQLDILLQKVNSNSNKDFLPQEKDYLINREIMKFIRQRFNPKSNNKGESIFDIIQRNQDLNSLIRTVPIDVIYIDEREVGYQLPFDFLSYIGTEVNIYPKCVGQTVPSQNVPIYYGAFSPIKVIGGLNAGLVSLTTGGTTYPLFNLSQLPEQYLPQDDIEDYKKAFIYNNAMLYSLKKNVPKGVEVRFNNHLQEFEFRSKLPIVLSYSLNGSPQNVRLWNNITVTTFISSPLSSEVRIIDEEVKGQIRKSSLSGSTAESVVGYLRENEVKLFNPKNAVVTKANLTYICKPAVVDVLLDSNSDLPDSILDQIISNTAESLKAIISSDTYEKFAKDNILIE